jgi:hypothetical protein
MTLEAALSYIRSLKQGESFSYRKVAKKYHISHTTLTEHHKGQRTTRAESHIHQRLLHPRDEAELVEYIKSLTEKHCPPTRQMIINFATPFCDWEPSDRWVSRLVHRHPNDLLTAWTTPMEGNRHKADSSERYRIYFDLLTRKVKEFDVLPRDTYNMDEKGFMIGVIGKTKRVFDKVLYKERRYKQASHDANREWVTVIGAICADGSHLPPAVIFSAASEKVQANWVHDIDPKTHSIYFSVSESGWTNDDLGVAWLEQVFDPATKEKARRNFRLLILDGHGSHVTRRFIDYCDLHRILVLVYPPHATHTLQPLDVSCFKPLSQSYSNELINHNYTTRGRIPVQKADFISLFWPAWVNTFTEKLISGAFKVTGIYPLHPDVILDRFKKVTPPPPVTPPQQSEPQPASTSPNWRRFRSSFDRAVTYGDPGAESEARQQMHQMHVALELKDQELQGLKTALESKKKRQKKKKVLLLSPRDPNVQGGSIFWDPASKARADRRMRDAEKQEIAEAAAKASKKQTRLTTKVLREKTKADNKVVAERKRQEKEERRAQEAQTKADRAAEKARAKALKDAQKVPKSPKQTRSKASKKPQSKVTKGGGAAARRRPQVVHEPSSAPQGVKTRSGRVTRPTNKLR